MSARASAYDLTSSPISTALAESPKAAAAATPSHALEVTVAVRRPTSQTDSRFAAIEIAR